MKHTMHLNPVPFEAIKSGKQSIETRIYDNKRRLIKAGDEIVFSKLPGETETITVEVIGFSVFRTFKDLFGNIDKRKFGYIKSDTLEYQLNCVYKHYTEEEEKEYGVVGIHIKVV